MFPVILRKATATLVLTSFLAAQAKGALPIPAEMLCPLVQAPFDEVRNSPVAKQASRHAEALTQRSDYLAREISQANAKGEPYVVDMFVIGAAKSGGDVGRAFQKEAPDSRVLFVDASSVEDLGLFGRNRNLRFVSQESDGHPFLSSTMQVRRTNVFGEINMRGTTFTDAVVLGHSANQSNILLETRVLDIEKPGPGESWPTKWRVKLQRGDEELYVYTDRIASGRGHETATAGTKNADSVAFREDELARLDQSVKTGGRPYFPAILDRLTSEKYLAAALKDAPGSDPHAAFKGRGVVIGFSYNGQSAIESAARTDGVKVTWVGVPSHIKNIDQYMHENPHFPVGPDFRSMVEGSNGAPPSLQFNSGRGSYYLPTTKEEQAKGLGRVKVYLEGQKEPLYADWLIMSTGYGSPNNDQIYQGLLKGSKSEVIERKDLRANVAPVYGGAPEPRSLGKELVIDGQPTGIYEVGINGGYYGGPSSDRFAAGLRSTGNDMMDIAPANDYLGRQLAKDVARPEQFWNMSPAKGSKKLEPHWYADGAPVGKVATATDLNVATNELLVRMEPFLERVRIASGGELKIAVDRDGRVAFAGVDKASADFLYSKWKADSGLRDAARTLLQVDERAPHGIVVSLPVRPTGDLALEKIRVGRTGRNSVSAGEEVVRGEKFIGRPIIQGQYPAEVQAAYLARQAKWDAELVKVRSALNTEKSPKVRLHLQKQLEKALNRKLAQARTDLSAAEGVLDVAHFDRTLRQAEQEYAAAFLAREAEARASSARLSARNPATASKDPLNFWQHQEDTFARLQSEGRYAGEKLEHVLANTEKREEFLAQLDRIRERDVLDDLHATNTMDSIVTDVVAKGDEAVGKKLAAQLEDSYAAVAEAKAAGRADEADLSKQLQTRGWTQDQIQSCGTICGKKGPDAPLPYNADKRATTRQFVSVEERLSVPVYVRDVLEEAELSRSTNAVAKHEALAIRGAAPSKGPAGSPDSVLKDLRALEKRLEGDIAAKKAANANPPPVHVTMEMKRMEQAKEHVRAKITALEAEASTWKGANGKVLVSDPKLMAETERLVLAYMQSADPAALAKIDSSFANPERRAWFGKVSTSGSERLQNYLDFKEAVSALPGSAKARLLESIEAFARTRPDGLKLFPAASADLSAAERAFQRSDRLAFGLARRNAEDLHQVFRGASFSDARIALAEAAGAVSDGPGRTAQRAMDSFAAKAAKEDVSRLNEARKLASVQEATELGVKPEVAKNLGKEILDSGKIRSFLDMEMDELKFRPEPLRGRIMDAMERVESGRSVEEVRSVLRKFKAAEDQPDSLELMTLIYEKAAAERAKNPNISWRDGINQGTTAFFEEQVQSGRLKKGDVYGADGYLKRMRECPLL